jgi:succinate dehydrogenase/fumarate reductase flavoprotein subunit
MKEMVDWGIRPDYTDERAVFCKGTAIMDALLKQARKTDVELMEDTAVFELVMEEGRVVGALGLDIRSGELLLFQCKAVVMASGGWHKAYTPVTGSRELTGDGIAMAFRAGAKAANMEFVTFACNVNYWPPIWRGSILGYVASLMYGNYLENCDNEPVFDKYDPWMIAYANRTEWNKSFISFISAQEIRAGKASPHGGLYYRLGKIPYEEFAAKVERYNPGWKFKGLDFSDMAEKMKSGEGIEVGPAAEYFEGGLAVDEHYATNLPGLYAAGECARSLFGANRVAAATMEMLTTGAIAGWSAGEYSQTARLTVCPPEQVRALAEKICRPLARKDGIKPSEIRGRIQVNAQEKLCPVRNAKELNEMLAFLDGLKEEIKGVSAQSLERAYNKSWLEALELENMIQVLELSARAALERTESRGVHYREEYPVTDNKNWLQEIVLSRLPAGIGVSRRPFNTSFMAPPQDVLPYLDMVKKMMQGHSDTGGHH